MNRPAVFITSVLIGSFSLTTIISNYLMRGVQQTAVTPTSASDQVVQAVKSMRVLSSTPDLGNPNDTRDYQAENITHFNNNTWLISDIPPRSPLDQQTTVVMKLEGKRYVIALGPGTDFPRDTLTEAGVPQDLINQLDSRGMVSTPEGP